MVLGEVVRYFASARSESTASAPLPFQDGTTVDTLTAMEERAESGHRRAEEMGQEVDLELGRPPYLHVRALKNG